MVFVFLLLVVASPSIRADWSFDNDGNIVSGGVSQVLGEKDEKKEIERKEEKKEERKEEKKEPERKELEIKQEKKTLEIKEKIEKKEVSEVKKEPQEKLIMKKDDIQEVQIERDKDSLQIKATDKKGEIRKQEQKEFELKTGDEEIKISTEDGKTSFKMKSRNSEVEIKTDSPLSVNPITKELVIKTPAGERSVAVLPDKAAEVISKLGVIDDSSKAAKMKLEVEDNKLVYKLAGTKQKKLLGFLPITLQREAVVSAETGNVIKTNESVLTTLLNFISL